MALKDTYFTISEAANELNISRQTLYRWIADSKIATEKIGGVILVKKDDVRAYVDLPTRMAVFAWGIKEARPLASEEYNYTSEDIF